MHYPDPPAALAANIRGIRHSKYLLALHGSECVAAVTSESDLMRIGVRGTLETHFDLWVTRLGHNRAMLTAADE